MKYLKKFNEAVIKPIENLTEILHKLCFFTENITLDKINLEFKKINIEFIDVDKFTNELKTDTEKSGVPRELNLLCGIKFSAVNGYKKMTYVCIEPKQFIESINDKTLVKKMYNLLLEMLRHETIHAQQLSRTKIDFYKDDKKIPNSVYNLEKSPEQDPKGYFSNKTETMAYAQSFIDQCRSINMSDEEILASIKGKKIVSWIQNVYNDMSDKTRAQFIKNVYLYLKGN